MRAPSSWVQMPARPGQQTHVSQLSSSTPILNARAHTNPMSNTLPHPIHKSVPETDSQTCSSKHTCALTTQAHLA